MNDYEIEYYVCHLELNDKLVPSEYEKVAYKIRSKLLRKCLLIYTLLSFLLIILFGKIIFSLPINDKNKALLSATSLVILIFIQRKTVDKMYWFFMNKKRSEFVSDEFIERVENGNINR